jgi:hypothetical protein
MVDISDLGGSGKRRPFPGLEKSTVERLAEATKSSFDDLDFGMKTMRDNLTSVDKLVGASLHATAVDKALKEALGGSLGDYYKSRDHMRDVFGSKSLSDEVDKLIKGPFAGSEVDNYVAEFERGRDERSIPDLPPMPHIPPNPIYETNEHLADVSEKIAALVDLQAKQAEVIDKLLQVQIANDAAQDRATKRSYRLGVVNAVLATILGIGAIVATIMIAG